MKSLNVGDLWWFVLVFIRTSTSFVLGMSMFWAVVTGPTRKKSTVKLILRKLGQVMAASKSLTQKSSDSFSCFI